MSEDFENQANPENVDELEDIQSYSKYPEELIEDYEKKQKRDRRQKIILIIIIIILLLLWGAFWKFGKIGYGGNLGESLPTYNEQMRTIKVSDKQSEITKDTDLNIFENQKFGGEAIIAPNSSGKYYFVIENIADVPVKYDIKFTDEMSNPVNMKYRLKIDNVYIRGNEKTYTDISALSVDDITVLKDSNNVFTLEWYWQNSDADDTYTGSLKSDQYYTLHLDIEAEVYKED